MAHALDDIAALQVVPRVEETLEEFLDDRRRALEVADAECGALAEAIEALVRSGGKRLRAQFCFWGWQAATPCAGPPAADSPAIWAGVALELVQAAALLHDDVIDRSDTRRGSPSAHRRFAAQHRQRGWSGDADRFGDAAAVLAGDLCLAWSHAALARATSQVTGDRADQADAVYATMTTELMGGQYLDLLVTAQPADPADAVERARRVIQFKTVRYTVERPLHLGVALAGGPDEVLQPLSQYAAALGEAFQLRDDLLGVFGDPEQTGKPSGDDLREGKKTVLLALATQSADPPTAALLERDVGDPTLDLAGIERLREGIAATGAAERVEQMISQLSDRADAALSRAPIDPTASAALKDLVAQATVRTR